MLLFIILLLFINLVYALPTIFNPFTSKLDFYGSDNNSNLKMNILNVTTICLSGNCQSSWNISSANLTAGNGIIINNNVINISAISCAVGNYSRYNGTSFNCFDDASGAGASDGNNYTTNISFNKSGNTIQLNLARDGMINLTALFTDADTTYSNSTGLSLSGTVFSVLDYLSGTNAIIYYVNRSSWTTIDNYPTACSANNYVTSIGDTLTCNIPPGTNNAHTHDAENITSGNLPDIRISNASVWHNKTSGGFVNCSSGTVLWNFTANSSGIYASCVADQQGSGGTGGINGTGLIGYVPLWNGTGSQNNSVLFQNGSNIGIGTNLIVTDNSIDLFMPFNYPNKRTFFQTIETEFCGLINTAEINNFYGTAIGSGTRAVGTGSNKHPCINTFHSSTTANSGYGINLGATSFQLNGSEKLEFNFNKASVTGNITILFIGFIDSTTAAYPVDGVFFAIINDTLNGRVRNNNAETNTSTNFTILTNFYYMGIIQIINNTLATFLLYNSTNTTITNTNLVWNNTIIANIPTTTGRETGAGFNIYKSGGTTAQTLLTMDYMVLTINRTINR